jgi:hypothetical protein
VGVASLATKDILYECEVWAVVRKWWAAAL